MRILILPILLLASGPVLLSAGGEASAQPTGTIMPGDAGGQGPGGLSARDIKGKRLLDANGAPLGVIEGVTPKGATVRTPDHQLMTVDMAKLSLGNGPHTVIESGDSAADILNRLAVNGTINK